MAERNKAKDEWVKANLQLDVDTPPTAAAEGEEEEGGGLEFSHTFPIKTKTIKAAGGRLEINLSLIIQVSCAVTGEHGGGTHLDPGGIAKAVGRFLVGWTDREAMPALTGGGGLFKSLKLERAGMGLTASAETMTAIGKFALEFVLVKVEAGAGREGATLALKAAEASATLTPNRVKLPDTVVDGIKLGKVVLEAGGQVTLAPNWPVVLGKWAAQHAAEEGAMEAGEVAATVVGGEALITGSLVAVGLSVIFGTLYSMAQGSKIGDLAVGVKPGIEKAKGGYKLAMSGYKAPSDPLALAGWTAGDQNRTALIGKARKQFPDAAEDDIKREIAHVAAEAVKQAEDTIVKAVRTGLWDGYLAVNKHVLLSGDAKWAFTACFGDNPKEGDPEWKKYLDQHAIGSKV